jgi:hypothetical protein
MPLAVFLFQPGGFRFPVWTTEFELSGFSHITLSDGEHEVRSGLFGRSAAALNAPSMIQGSRARVKSFVYSFEDRDAQFSATDKLAVILGFESSWRPNRAAALTL